MNSITLILALAAVVAVSIIIIVASQLREKARIERARKITALEDRYKRCERLLTELPGQYLTPELKLLLLNEMEAACDNLAAFSSGLPIEKWREAATQEKARIQDEQDTTTPVAIDTPEKSRYIKELLESLFKLIISMHKSGRIDGETSREKQQYILFLVHKTHADLHVFQAREHIRKNQIRQAIHAYHMASTEMGKSRDNPLATRAVKAFRKRITELEAVNEKGESTGSAEPDSELDKQWDRFFHEDDWKKKPDYDD